MPIKEFNSATPQALEVVNPSMPHSSRVTFRDTRPPRDDVEWKFCGSKGLPMQGLSNEEAIAKWFRVFRVEEIQISSRGVHFRGRQR
jgi:hypothetical protein